MKQDRVVIFGVSGHAKVIADIIGSDPSLKLVGFIDKDSEVGTEVLGHEVLGDDPSLPQLMQKYDFCKGVVGIGDNFIRSKVASFVFQLVPKFEFVNCIHSSATISKHCEMGTGNVVMPGVVINSSSRIANHCVLNTNSSLDHDCFMNDFSSIAPNAAVGGNSVLGAYASVGIGASIFHGVSIGENCIVGGGSLVTSDTQANSVFYGIPAKFVRTRNLGEKYL